MLVKNYKIDLNMASIKRSRKLEHTSAVVSNLLYFPV
jgi:hypothetical protein